MRNISRFVQTARSPDQDKRFGNKITTHSLLK